MAWRIEEGGVAIGWAGSRKRDTLMHTILGAAHTQRHTLHIQHTNAFEQAFRMLIWCGLLRILVYLLWFSSLFSHFLVSSNSNM